jgi:ABC-2 type transport system permease protein
MRPANTATRATTRLRRAIFAYATETKFECLRVLRSPGFTIPMLFLPLGFYLLLGVGMAGMRSEPDGGRSVLIFVSFLVYGIVAPGLLGVSSLLAGDGVQKIVEYKRALPAPYGSQIVAKLLMALALSIAVIVLLIGLGATLGDVPLNAGQFVATGTIVLAGVFPVSAIGSYLATRATPSGVSPIAGALLVGMAILGGLFYPLPGVLSALRPLWPTYHLQQLCLAALGQATTDSPATNIVALIGFTVLFGFLAASRLARPD